jgi:cell division protein DivIC
MRRKRKSGTGIGIIAFVVLMLCAIVSYKRIGLAQEVEDKSITIDRLETQLQEEQERTHVIEEYKAYMKTRKYIEDMARKIGLVYKDEILFKSEEPE